MSTDKRLANLTGGSRKGKPNKTTRELKEMVFGALEANGGQKYLEDQAIMNPTAFMTLLGKFVPKDMNLSVDTELKIIINKPSADKSSV